MESTHTCTSAALGYAKKLWILGSSETIPAKRVLVFLDAEIYLPRVKALEVIEPLLKSKAGEGVCVVFVSNGTEEQRTVESLFSGAFSTFLCEELPAFLRREKVAEVGPSSLLCGLSLTGLASVMAAVDYPKVYQKIAAQSGAYWPEEGRVLGELKKLTPGHALSFYFDVGSEETDREGEVMSQQEGVEAVQKSLKAKGYPVTTFIYEGGHNTKGWRSALPRLVDWALT